MPPEGTDGQAAHTWMRYAEADLDFARMPLPERGLYEQLCFHAQQAAEKSVKAVLARSGVDFPHTHNLQALVDLLPQDISRTQALIDAARLTAYAVSCRYPTQEEPVGEDEYREVLGVAASVVEWAAALLQAANGAG